PTTADSVVDRSGKRRRAPSRARAHDATSSFDHHSFVRTLEGRAAPMPTIPTPNSAFIAYPF
ncbi:MAG TPA: hypothetical protein VIF62_36880, partial [Labilithrix sp.]